MKTNIFIIIIILALALLVFLGLSQAKKIPDTAKGAAPSKITFHLLDLEENPTNAEDFIGKKPVVISFFATWCPPCQLEMSHLQKLYTSLNKEQVGLIAINIKENKEKVAAFAEKYKLTFPILMDEDGQAARQFGVSGIPSLFILDKNGNIAFRMVGFRENMEEIIQRELKPLI